MSSASSGLLLDTDLMVLYIVGGVNRARIPVSKRTSKYTGSHYDLLLEFMAQRRSLHTLPHVIAEVSNLIDLKYDEGAVARALLKEFVIEHLQEHAISSKSAVNQILYEGLGVTDAGIALVAQQADCTVLTDDLNLYLGMERLQVEAYCFTHFIAERDGI